MNNVSILSGLQRAPDCGFPGRVPGSQDSRIRRRTIPLARFVVAISLLLTSISSHAIIFFSTADPAYNTTAPAGSLAGSGWQYQGRWGSFLGTTIAPQYFITASHVGGTVGDKFTFAGVDYATTALFDDPNSDLRIWRVCGTFPAFAPLYTGSDEAGKSLMIFGRGTQRGAAVTIGSGANSVLKGWQWGTPDGVQRWGENQVGSIVDGNGKLPLFGGGGSGIGDLLKAPFNAGGGANEAHISTGDSGGAVFIKDGSVWKLAGINYSVDGPYNTTSTGAGFAAAIFDEGGLYTGGEGHWSLSPDLPFDMPGAFYATRISSNLGWINSVLSLSAPGDSTPILQEAIGVAGPYLDNTSAVIDPNAKMITVAITGGLQFYRLRSCGSRRIASIRISGGSLVLTYE